jgi:RNA polymerase sigma-70 factor (ECF subfamily)
MRPTLVYEGAISASEKILRAFNDLRDELVSTLWYILGNKDDAQDAAQDAFVKCWKAQDTIKDVRNLRAWIFRVALNVARDQQRSAWYRRSKQLNGEDVMLLGQDVSPDQAAANQEELGRIRQAIMHLRQDEKEVFLLRQNGDLTFEEIAEIRRSPLGTVKTQMRSALQKLRRILT